MGPVWKQFTKRYEPGDGHTSCNYCKLVLKTRTGTTTTLIRHLKRKHGDAFKLYERDKNDNAELSELTANASVAKKSVTPSSQPSIAGFAKQGIKYKPESPVAKKINKKITTLLAVQYLPYTFVNCFAFRDLMACSSSVTLLNNPED